MIVSHKHKLVCMCPPKTGSTSITRILEDSYCGKIKKWHGRFRHQNLNDEHICHLPSDLKNYFVFAIVRNPFEHQVSRYTQFFHKENFERWSLRDKYDQFRMLHQDNQYVPPEGCVRYNLDCYIQLENIDNQFSRLPFVKEKVKVPWLNNGRRKRSRMGYYTQETINKLVIQRSKDFEEFNYSTECPGHLWLRKMYM